MKVIYHNRHTNAEAEQKYGAVYVSKEELMEQADFVVIVTPLTEETRGMVGEAEINLMKPTGILVNVARGRWWMRRRLRGHWQRDAFMLRGWMFLRKSLRRRIIRCYNWIMWCMCLILARRHRKCGIRWPCWRRTTLWRVCGERFRPRWCRNSDNRAERNQNEDIRKFS